MRYIRTIKRIRQHKTNYRKRAAILVGRHHFITVKITNQNVLTRLLSPDIKGDKVLASVHSRELAKQGWNGSLNSLPACYLTGILLGKKCLEKNLDNAVLYTGMNQFTSRVAACLKGIVDAGVRVPVSEDSFPDQDRLEGNHIASYAKLLQENKSEYQSKFSLLLKNGLKPEDYPAHVQKVKGVLMERLPSKSDKQGSKPNEDQKSKVKMTEAIEKGPAQSKEKSGSEAR
jgi:large subunit ribosomal protein L18